MNTLVLMREDDWHALWVSWLDDGAQWGWYVNLQQPYRRTALRDVEKATLIRPRQGATLRSRPVPSADQRAGAPLVIGTAGHIDHGKTWLVRALTGKDTDRLPEERERGISIDLGYAPLELASGRLLSVVDVPGHERFVRNMVAGATGIDLFLLVIDAAEGARPQTHEHLAILRLLGIERGVVAVTKVDAVDGEVLELAIEEARDLVPGVAVLPVSAKTGAGLDDLRSAIDKAAENGDGPRRDLPTRLFVDRVFTLKGIGTVATGTLWSGAIAEGEELRAEPAGTMVRIRSVQVHDRPVSRAEAGQRVAVSLPGIDRSALRRGDALVETGAYPVGYRLDVTLEPIQPIADGARLLVHHGTSEIPARVRRVGNHYAQLRLATPVVAARGDRVVLRAGTTLGGGVVVDPSPPRAASTERLDLLVDGDPASIVCATVHEPVTRAQLLARGLLGPRELDEGLRRVQRAGDWYFGDAWLREQRGRITAHLQRRVEEAPLDPSVPVAQLFPGKAWAADVLPELGIERRGAKAYLPGTGPSRATRGTEVERLEGELAEAGFDPIRPAEIDVARYLEETGRLVRVGEGLAIGAEAYEQARTAVIAECERAGSIRLARLRDLLGTSRRSAQLLLERLDADSVTRRIGDERVLRRAARSPR